MLLSLGSLEDFGVCLHVNGNHGLFFMSCSLVRRWSRCSLGMVGKRKTCGMDYIRAMKLDINRVMARRIEIVFRTKYCFTGVYRGVGSVH
jgi:hypothetical protein